MITTLYWLFRRLCAHLNLYWTCFEVTIVDESTGKKQTQYWYPKKSIMKAYAKTKINYDLYGKVKIGDL